MCFAPPENLYPNKQVLALKIINKRIISKSHSEIYIKYKNLLLWDKESPLKSQLTCNRLVGHYAIGPHSYYSLYIKSGTKDKIAQQLL